MLRARRVTSHSLWTNQRPLMETLIHEKMNLTITKHRVTGEVGYTIRQEFPPEELLESLAARIRPLTLEGDDLHWSKVLTSIEALTDIDRVPDFVKPMQNWREGWERVAARDGTAQAYYIITEQGRASDQDLMYAWFYGDVVHADDKEAQAKGLGVNERYRAAASIVARLVERVQLTLMLVESLAKSGALEVDPELFARDVVVTKTVFETPARAYAAEASTEVGDDVSEPLDSRVWTPMSDALAEHMPDSNACEAWKNSRRNGPTVKWPE